MFRTNQKIWNNPMRWKKKIVAQAKRWKNYCTTHRGENKLLLSKNCPPSKIKCSIPKHVRFIWTKYWDTCPQVNSANPTLSYPANKSIPVWAIHITPASSISSWIVGDNTRSLVTLDIRLVSSPVCVQCERMVAPDELRRVSVTGETEPQASSEILQIKNNKCCREEK